MAVGTNSRPKKERTRETFKRLCSDLRSALSEGIDWVSCPQDAEMLSPMGFYPCSICLKWANSFIQRLNWRQQRDWDKLSDVIEFEGE